MSSVRYNSRGEGYVAGPSDGTTRSCYDCAHLRGYVSWWCKSEDAIKARGTAIPGVTHCRFWQAAPMRTQMHTPWWRKIVLWWCR